MMYTLIVYIIHLIGEAVMFRTQIYLTKEMKERLNFLVKDTGQSQSTLIREAVNQFIESKMEGKKNKKNAFEAAEGLWANRENLPDFENLRREFER